MRVSFYQAVSPNAIFEIADDHVKAADILGFLNWLPETFDKVEDLMCGGYCLSYGARSGPMGVNRPIWFYLHDGSMPDEEHFNYFREKVLNLYTLYDDFERCPEDSFGYNEPTYLNGMPQLNSLGLPV